eukprot:CAMPEP_0195089376 /NCGR_PEP_ID=MMETSP0448-20130528/28684_1 /TAXON_ID=66468 /ORGANISM="Heterocapsa triquestra, Strain CCMP 448" /LENGTH=314 /DNA_ID=CAMNT_0040123103 /DNA_START=33 /DNA_END=974 /DNA_ORIENTATION=-
MIWKCEGAHGTNSFWLEGKERNVVLGVPKGVKNLQGDFKADADIDVELYDPASNQFVLRYSNGIVNNDQRTGYWEGLQVTYTGDDTTAPAYEGFSTKGVIPSPLELRFHNYDVKRVQVSVDYTYDGLVPCPSDPTGCGRYMEDAAQHQVKEWSCWAQLVYPTPEEAWNALGRPHEMNLTSGVEGGVPWWKWPSAFKNDRTSGVEQNSWQQAFKWLDANGDMEVSKQEFVRGYELCTEQESRHADDGAGWLPWAIVAGLLACALCAGLAVLYSLGGHKKRSTDVETYRSLPKDDPGSDDDLANHREQAGRERHKC